MKKILITLPPPSRCRRASPSPVLARAQANDDGLCWNGWIWATFLSGPGLGELEPVGGAGAFRQQHL